MISFEKRDACLDFLATTDEPLAAAKSYMIGVEDQKSTVLSMEQIESKHKAIGNKKADAYTTKAYFDWCKKHRESVYDFELIRNRRITALLFVECWRSENSARTKGLIL